MSIKCSEASADNTKRVLLEEHDHYFILVSNAGSREPGLS